MREQTRYEVAVENLLQDPETAHLTAVTLKKLNDGFYGPWLPDVVFQKWGRLRTTLYDAFGFIQIHTKIHQGEIGLIRIDASGGPTSDSERHTNQKALEGLCPPFRATVDKEQRIGADGRLMWTSPVVFTPIQCDEDDCPSRTAEPFWIDPSSADLEIGYQPVHKTYTSIMVWGSLARWPYGSDSIFLLYNKTPESKKANETGGTVNPAVFTVTTKNGGEQ